VRIFSVTPIHVDETELGRRQARYDELTPDGVTVELQDLGADAPTALDTEEQVRRSEHLVRERLRSAADQGYDAVLPDCVLDPAVSDLDGVLGVPVVGLLQLSVGHCVGQGHRVGAVTRNRAIAEELAARVQAYGWEDSFVGVEVLDLDVHAISDTRRWDEALAAAVASLAEAGATVVINGCSAVEVVHDDLSGVTVVDPTALALRIVGEGGAA
jgi:allantoin racemase